VSQARTQIFEGILARPAEYRGLAQTGLAVFGVYMMLLTAALWMGHRPQRPKPPPEKRLTVTLLDLPRVSEERSLGESGRAGGGGEVVQITEQNAVEAEAPSAKPSVRAQKSTKVDTRTKAAPTEAVNAKAGATVDPTPSAPQVVQQGTSTESTAPRTETAQAPTTHAEGAGGGSGSGQGGSAGSGSGAGSGNGASGLGTGSGARAGAASGDQTTYPFMDGMTRPELVSKVDPEYTKEARDANVQGLILTKCVIGTDGSLKRCKIVKGLPLMDQQVLSALSHWRYSPVYYQGKPVQVEYVIPVRLMMR
jgi:periplasmic protein TonB